MKAIGFTALMIVFALHVGGLSKDDLQDGISNAAERIAKL